MRGPAVRSRRLAALVAAALALVVGAPSPRAQSPSLEETLTAVVRLKAFIDPDARTLQNLGREREGSGVVIDADGLVLTIGYLMVEAHAVELTTSNGRTVPANVVGYDPDTGFGLVRATAPLKVRPLSLGRSADLKEGDPVVAAGFGGVDGSAPARVVSRRAFAGSWEYLLDDAIFTTPPHPAWSGAALIDRSGRLVGIGSLIVADAGGKGEGPGNMFVPIDSLAGILGDLIADGRAAVAKPWLGATTEEVDGHLVVSRVQPASPAEKAGLRRGDLIVGVGGDATRTLAELWRRIRALGPAGVSVPLDVVQDGEGRRIDVTSMDRMQHLRLKGTL